MAIDLAGERYGRLTVVKKSDAKRGKSKSIFWECQCDCGNTSIVSSNALRRGHSRSCGCLREERRLAGLPAYKKRLEEKGVYDHLLKSKKRDDNKTGIKGVSPTIRNGKIKYRAYISVNNKTHHLGLFDKKEDAISARKRGESKYHKPYLEEKDENS